MLNIWRHCKDVPVPQAVTRVTDQTADQEGKEGQIGVSGEEPVAL